MTSVLDAFVGAQGAIWATAIMTVLLLVFAEVLPKTVAINNADRVSLLFVRVLAPFVAIFGPILLAIELFVRGFLALFRGGAAEHQRSMLSGAEELKSTVDLLHKEGQRRALRPRHVRRPARPRGADRARHHGPSHLDDRDLRRAAAGRAGAGSGRLALFAAAAVARRARQHRRRALRQGFSCAR